MCVSWIRLMTDQTFSAGNRDGLQLGVRTETADGALDVVAHRVHTQTQILGDGHSRRSVSEAGEHIGFSLGERVPPARWCAQSIDDGAHQLGGQRTPTGVDGTHCIDELADPLTLEQEPARTGLECSHDQLVIARLEAGVGRREELAEVLSGFGARVTVDS